MLIAPLPLCFCLPSEQQRAIARLKTSFTGLEHGAAPDLLGGLRDCRGLYLGLFAMLYNSCVIVFSAFTPTIIANLLKPIGVAPEEAYIYSVALTSFPYLLALVEINASAYAFRHTPSRCYWGYGISLLAVVIILFSILPLAYNSGVFPVAFLTFSFLQAGVTAFVGVKDILPGLYLQKNGASASYFAVYNSMRNLSSIWIPSLAGMMMPVWGDAEAVMVIGLAHAIPSMFLFTGWFYLIGQDQPFPLAWPRKEVKDTATKSPCEAPSKYDCATPTVV